MLVVTAALLYGTRRKEVEEKYVEKVCCQPELEALSMSLCAWYILQLEDFCRPVAKRMTLI